MVKDDKGGNEIDREIHNQRYVEHSFLVESKELERAGDEKETENGEGSSGKRWSCDLHDG